MSKHDGDYPRDVYPDRRKAAERRERERAAVAPDRRTTAREIGPDEGERFAGAFGLHVAVGYVDGDTLERSGAS